MAAAAPELSIAIPLYNEAGNVDRIARGLVHEARLAGVALDLVLVDNGSADDTGARADALAASLPEVRAVRVTPNRGYGGGILAGISECRAPVLGYMWGDGQVRPEVALAVYRRLVDEGLDLCKARRVDRHDGLVRLGVTRVYNWVFPLLFPVGSDDANGCPKLFTRQAWERIAPRSADWFLDPEILILARRHGMRVGEVDAVFHPREHGRSKVRLSTVAEFGRNLVSWRLKGGPP